MKTKGAKFIIEYLESLIKEYEQGIQNHNILIEQAKAENRENAIPFHRSTIVLFQSFVNELQARVLHLKFDNKINS